VSTQEIELEEAANRQTQIFAKKKKKNLEKKRNFFLKKNISDIKIYVQSAK